MFRSVRPSVLLALLVAIACTDQPTEPTIGSEGSSLSMTLPPVPAPPTPLSGSFTGSDGAPSTIQLGFWEAPVVARVTVTGLLHYSNDGGAGSGYLPGNGFIDAQGIYVPSGNSCALQLSVRVAGFGPIGGAFGSCPSTINQVGQLSRVTVVSGQVYAQRIAGPPGSCYTGGTPCTSITGTQTVTVEPLDADLSIVADKPKIFPGGLIRVDVAPEPAFLEGVKVPWTFREFRWEGQGPTVGGGQTKVCVAQPVVGECLVGVYQSGYVVGEAIVNGRLKTEKVWVAVIGGDSLPPPPPPDSMPPDSMPPDSVPGGGGGGGGGCGAAIVQTLSHVSGPMRACEPPTPVKLTLTLGPAADTPILSGNRPWILPARTVGPDGGEYQDFGSPPRSFGRPWPDSMVYEIQIDSAGSGLSRAVTVLLEGFDSAGTTIDAAFGHYHSGRIVNGSALPKPIGTVSASSVSTDASGNAKFVYHPGEVSGPVLVKVIVQNADTIRDTLWVGVPNLVNLLSETKFDLKEFDESNIDHPDHFWVTEDMRALLEDLGDSVVATFAQRPTITDAGLRFGGRYDLDDQWSNADAQCGFTPEGGTTTSFPIGCHWRHRLGNDADLRTNDIPVAQRNFARRKWRSISGFDVTREGNHDHLVYRP